jgi:hypothetical protein
VTLKAASSAFSPREELYSSHHTRFVLEIVNLTTVSLLDDLLPPSAAKPAQLPKDGTVADRVFQRTASCGRPSRGNRSRCQDTVVKVKGHKPCWFC